MGDYGHDRSWPLWVGEVGSRERGVDGEVILLFDLALQLRLRWGLARPAQFIKKLLPETSFSCHFVIIEAINKTKP